MMLIMPQFLPKNIVIQVFLQPTNELIAARIILQAAGFTT